MFSIKKIKLTITIFLITTLLFHLSNLHMPRHLLWDREIDKDIDWVIQTDFDVLIAGSNKKLYALSERRGENIWSIESGPDINRDDVVILTAQIFFS